MDKLPVETNTNYMFKAVIFFFIAISIWWLSIFTRGLNGSLENNVFTLVYPLFSLAGGIYGFFVAQKWGGFKSVIGKAILFFTYGLLFQFLGQAIFAYYIYIQGIQVPYPSLGDIGFLGSTICYIIAGWFLMRVSGFHLSFKSTKGKILAIITPIILLIISYQFFLKGYQFDWSNPIKVFLDFGYPLSDTLYVSLAVVALILCQKFMGGIMKSSIRLLIFALLFQYIADFTFLYQSSVGTWYVGGINDFLYCTSYFLMTLSIIRIGQVFEKIKSTQ